MIMDSCGAEGDDGFQNVAGRSVDNKFIYAKGKTYVVDFGATADTEGELNFDVKYDEAETIVMQHGKKVSKG